MIWNDPLHLALLGSTLTPLLTWALAHYMGSHYTRLPDGRWTTWEQTLESGSEAEELAA